MNRLSLLTLLGVGLAAGIYWQFGQGTLPEFSHFLPSVDDNPSVAQRGKTRNLHTPEPSFRGSMQSVRVRLLSVVRSPVSLQSDVPVLLRNLKTGKTLQRWTSLPASAATAVPGGIRLGRTTLPVRDIELVPGKPESPAIWVNRHQYRGRVRLHRREASELLVVNVVPLGYYVASVLNGEMPAAFPAAARKAQAVIARTYALYRMQQTGGFGLFDVFADERSQQYPGFQYRDKTNRRLAGETAESRQRVNETAGWVVTLNGRLFSPYYSAVCGGRTTAGRFVFKDAAVLKSVPCAWCRNAPLYRWTISLPRQRAEAALRRLLARQRAPFGRLRSVRTLRPRRDEGQPAEFLIGDGTRQYRLHAVNLREALPTELPSPRFELQLTRRELIIRGRGHGHGVGLCQYGAAGLARAGRSFRQILQYYYPGVTFQSAKERHGMRKPAE